MNLVLRQPGLSSKFLKNLDYTESTNVTKGDLEFATMVGGAEAMLDLALKYRYAQEGAQLRVAKQVSDALLDTTFHADVTFADIPWPKRVLEIYFDDPNLPTILVGKLPWGEIKRTFVHLNYAPDIRRAYNVSDEELCYLAVLGLPNGSSSIIILSRDTWDVYLRGRLGEMMPGSMGVDDLEGGVGREMSALALRVLAYASIPQAIGESESRKTMKTGGKPGVKNRPSRPNIRVIYLPRKYFEETQQHQHQGTGTGRKVEYRAPHLRFFKHERYTYMRGKFIFIEAIGTPPAVPVKTQYRVTV